MVYHGVHFSGSTLTIFFEVVLVREFGGAGIQHLYGVLVAMVTEFVSSVQIESVSLLGNSSIAFSQLHKHCQVVPHLFLVSIL